MEVGENVYYFPKKEVQTSLQRLYNQGIYTQDHKIKYPSGHNLEKTFKYMCDVIEKNSHIEFEILSNRKFPKYKNLKQL